MEGGSYVNVNATNFNIASPPSPWVSMVGKPMTEHPATTEMKDG